MQTSCGLKDFDFHRPIPSTRSLRWTAQLLQPLFKAHQNITGSLDPKARIERKKDPPANRSTAATSSYSLQTGRNQPSRARAAFRMSAGIHCDGKLDKPQGSRMLADSIHSAPGIVLAFWFQTARHRVLPFPRKGNKSSQSGPRY